MLISKVGGGGGPTVDEKSYQTSWATLTFTAGGRVWICGDCGGVCSVLCVVSGTLRVFSSVFFDNRFL